MRGSQRNVLMFAAGALVVGLFVWAWFESMARDLVPTATLVEGTKATEDATHTPGQSTVGQERDRKAEQTQASEIESVARTSVVTSVLSGRVFGPDQQPRAGATLSLVVLMRDLPSDSGGWFEVPWERVRESTVWSMTDSNGVFSFDEVPEAAFSDRLALWVTHRECESHLTILDPIAADEQRQIDVSLEHAKQWTAHVADEDGSDVAGASVIQIGIRGRERVGVGSDIDIAYRLFFRDWTTDSTGRVQGAPVGGTFGLLASKDLKIANAWFGTDVGQEDIPLILRSTFTLSGIVRGCLPTEKGASRAVFCSGVRGTSRLPLLHFLAREDGSFGPVPVPLRDVEQLELRFDGGSCRSNRTFVPRPSVGEQIFVELNAERGEDVIIDVQTTTGEKLPGAQVWVAWDHEGLVESSGGRTDIEGRIIVRGCRAGNVRFGADAKGFVNAVGNASIPTEGGAPITLKLAQGGQVRVRVTHAGQPVPNFDLIYEGIQPPTPLGRKAALDKADGVFTLDSVPIGTIYIVAQSTEHPRSDDVVVQVQAGETAEVEIELPAPLLGRGRVVDAVTREPVTDAWAQVFTNRGGIMLLPWGAKLPVDADGRFELSGFAPGETRCKVGAPGYSDTYGRAIGAVGATVELGEITLARLQPLTVELSGGEGFDLTKFRAYAQGLIALEERSFSSDGRVRWESVGFGKCDLTIEGPVQSLDARLDLVPGRDWHFVLPLAGAPTLAVELESADPTQPVPKWAASSFAGDSQSAQCQKTIYADSDGIARFHGLRGPHAVIECFELDTGTVLATDRIQLTGSDQHVRVRMGRKTLAVRVIDSARAPIPGAEIALASSWNGGAWKFGQLADADGWARWTGLNLDRVDVHLYHASIGSRADLSVALDRDVNEVEFVLEADARVRVRAMDGAQVLSGVPVEIGDSSGVYDYGVFAGDGNGISESRAVHEGRYLVRVRTPSIWPFEGHFSAREDEGYDVLQLRRRGGLELVVFDANGARVANAIVLLASNELGSSVADWLASGLCTSSSSSLSTNDQGVLVIDGIPRGDYTWTCGSASGITTVEPLKRRTVELRLP